MSIRTGDNVRIGGPINLRGRTGKLVGRRNKFLHPFTWAEVLLDGDEHRLVVTGNIHRLGQRD